MNILSEFQRVWSMDVAAGKMVRPDFFFGGPAPDTIQDETTGKTIRVEAPFISVSIMDDSTGDSTNETIAKLVPIQLSVFASRRADAERIRDYARDLFEDCDIKLGGENARFQDCSIDLAGEVPPVDGLFHCFQRFTVEVSISRPNRRKRV